VGRVVAVGEGLVQQDWFGKRVLPANSAPCMACSSCKKARFSQCEHLQLLNGAYADYLVLPAPIVARNTYVVPDDAPVLQLATAEPLAVCLKGMADTAVRHDDHVAIIGVGPIALIWTLLLQRQGCHVTLLGRDSEKLAAAKRLTGAETGLLAEAADNTYDVVVDATGQPECWERAVALVARGGTVQLFGGCPRGTTVTFSTERLHYDEIRLVSSFHHTPEYFKLAVSLLSNGEIDLRFLIRHELPLSSAHEAFKLMDDGLAQKVALWP
jgi:L-iditol 2-dehydrogenase